MDRECKNPADDNRLKAIKNVGDIPMRWSGTPIEKLIKAHNFDETIEPSTKPELFISTCIDFRLNPKVPPYFAYESRRANGRLIDAEFMLVYGLVKGVRHVVLLGHNDCGMTKVAHYKDGVIAVLVDQGWPRDRAEHYVTQQGVRYAIADELEALQLEYVRLRRLFPKVEIAPLFADIADGKLYLPKSYDHATADMKSEFFEHDLLLL
jgi:carbonic anhydrase